MATVRAAVLLLAIAITACTTPIGEAVTGDAVRDFAVRDLRTGTCLKIIDQGKWQTFKVMHDGYCEPLR